jgi:hypothetical protein
VKQKPFSTVKEAAAEDVVLYEGQNRIGDRHSYKFKKATASTSFA